MSTINLTNKEQEPLNGDEFQGNGAVPELESKAQILACLDDHREAKHLELRRIVYIGGIKQLQLFCGTKYLSTQPDPLEAIEDDRIK